jgi:signal transduction histidine kinase
MDIRKLLKPKHFLILYFLWILFLSVIYFVAIQAQKDAIVPFVWLLIGLSGVSAIFVGIHIHKPSIRCGWIFLALANLFFIIGDTIYNVIEYLLKNSNAFPSIADLFYLLTYPLFAAGMFIFIRRRTSAQSEKGAILDAAIFSTGLGMFVWIFLVVPNASADTSLTVKSLSVAYPLFDILIWAMLVRLLLTGLRIRAIQFLAIGASGLIFSDIFYAINQFYGVWYNGTFIDVGWICFYTFWGAAALHPSMRRLDKAEIKNPHVRPTFLIPLAGTALIAPALLLIEYLRGDVNRVAVSISVFSAILFILVILRMVILVRAISNRDADISLEKKKNEAFSLVSHQLKTPVTAVKQLIDLVLEGYVGEITTPQRDILTKAYSDNLRLLRIVEDLLNVGQLDSGKLRLHKIKVDVVGIIKDILDEVAPQLKQGDQKLNFLRPRGKLVANVDADRLKMVLENLIDNASKYSTEGKLIEVKLTKMKRTFKISIKDQGVGINQIDLERLFQKFSRIENPLSNEVGGTGLGLYWAKKIIDLHGGKIKVNSKSGKGTTFIISLPL